jgi:hypothetical protein
MEPKGAPFNAEFCAYTERRKARAKRLIGKENISGEFGSGRQRKVETLETRER